MLDVVTPEEMAAIDAAAPEPVEILVERAGGAVARAALGLLGGTYGRRVVVVAGPGNNGADGRVAGVRLARRGAHVIVVEAGTSGSLPPADLVIDAAYGTGLSRPYTAPDPGGARVLAVDIPSGVHGLTGRVLGSAMRADRTVTFAALKPGLLLREGRELAGRIEVADIGLDTARRTMTLVEDRDLDAWPLRPADAHKYHASVWVIGGSPDMTGAPTLAARGAFRAGSGYVRLSVPGAERHPADPVEAVGAPLPAAGWAGPVLEDLDRIRALVVGPGLGRDDSVRSEVGRLLGAPRGPIVVDGDGLWALAQWGGSVVDGHRVVLTPHDGELRTLLGRELGEDRIADARELAGRLGVTVLTKGRTTVVAGPTGEVRFVTSGDARLATAGTGDVLAGMVGALLAGGLSPLDAAALAAHAHGRAARLGRRIGLVASDLPDLLSQVLDTGRGGWRL